jgi:hypothetical protein
VCLPVPKAHCGSPVRDTVPGVHPVQLLGDGGWAHAQDVLIGDDGPNQLAGGKGRDILVGHAGGLLGSDDEAVRQWFGAGMLDNVTTALGLADVDEPWARTLSGP